MAGSPVLKPHGDFSEPGSGALGLVPEAADAIREHALSRLSPQAQQQYAVMQETGRISPLHYGTVSYLVEEDEEGMFEQPAGISARVHPDTAGLRDNIAAESPRATCMRSHQARDPECILAQLSSSRRHLSGSARCLSPCTALMPAAARCAGAHLTVSPASQAAKAAYLAKSRAQRPVHLDAPSRFASSPGTGSPPEKPFQHKRNWLSQQVMVRTKSSIDVLHLTTRISTTGS